MSWLGDFLFGKASHAPTIEAQFKDLAESYAKHGPKMFEALAAQERAQAGVDYQLANQYAPQYIALETALQNQYGPGLAAAEAQSNAVTGNAAAKLEQALISQYGPVTARAILATQQAADPSGTAAKGRLEGLFNTYVSNLSPELNGSEIAGINRSLAQQNPYQVGSQLETIKNAQTFGDKGTAKLAAFGEGAARAASLLPAVSTGVQPFNVSTLGRGATDSSLSIVDKLLGKDLTSAGAASGTNTVNQLFGFGNLREQIAAGNKDRGFLQAWTRFGSGLKDYTASADNATQAVSNLYGGGIGGCHIAREVFGLTDPRWLQFRSWLFSDASPRLREWYLLNGPRVAIWLRKRPQTKQRIMKMMMEVIK